VFNNDANYAASRIVGTYLPLTNKRGLAYIIDLKKSNGSNSLKEASILASSKKSIGGDYESFKITDFLFSVGSLGYVNSRFQGAAYLVRLPIRRDYKQGLRTNQCAIQRNTSLLNLQGEWLSQNISTVSDCINGVFPSVEEAIERVEEQTEDVAFSRSFAVSANYKLLYKGFNAGKLTKDDKLLLDAKFSFLEQELSKVVGNEKISI
jgi:hypothetical protein